MIDVSLGDRLGLEQRPGDSGSVGHLDHDRHYSFDSVVGLGNGSIGPAKVECEVEHENFGELPGGVDDVVEVRDKSKKIQSINDSLDAVVRRGIPQWLELEKENFRGMIKGFPVREDITMPIQEQLIIELYSK